LKKEIIWAGTDDGLVHLTIDGGKTWKDVTPPALKSWDKVTQIDAGHFDEQTAYISVNAIRKDDMKPYIYRTHDGGVTWKEITLGLYEIGPVNAVREDPKQQGLLFAGTEREVYFRLMMVKTGNHCDAICLLPPCVTWSLMKMIWLLVRMAVQFGYWIISVR
jgi:photosystem II stability/assembly factor-like uncharacterized protein